MKKDHKPGEKLFYIERVFYKEDDDFCYVIKKGVLEYAYRHDNGISYQFHNGSAQGNMVFECRNSMLIAYRNMFNKYCEELWTRLTGKI